MKQERKWVRYCLLFMSEEEQSFFEINKETLGDFYQIQVDNLIKDKKNQKERTGSGETINITRNYDY